MVGETIQKAIILRKMGITDTDKCCRINSLSTIKYIINSFKCYQILTSINKADTGKITIHLNIRYRNLYYIRYNVVECWILYSTQR